MSLVKTDESPLSPQLVKEEHGLKVCHCLRIGKPHNEGACFSKQRESRGGFTVGNAQSAVAFVNPYLSFSLQMSII